MIYTISVTENPDEIAEQHQAKFCLTHWEIRTGEDIIPDPPAPAVIPVGEFRKRFTEAEMDLILALAYNADGDATARKLLLKLQTEDIVNCCDPLVTAAMNYVVSKGCLTTQRMIEILSGHVTEQIPEWNDFG